MTTVQLPIDLYSPDQLSVHIQGLRQLLDSQRDALTQRRVTGKSTAHQLTLSPTMHSLLKLNGVAADRPFEIEKLISTLEAFRLEAPVVHLTFATLPNHTLTQQLTVWFRTQIHPQTLITFIMSREIGGGVVVRTGSSIYDFSFRTQLLRHKDTIAEIFARV